MSALNSVHVGRSNGVPARSARARLDALEDAVACLDAAQDRLIRGVFYAAGPEIKARLLRRLSLVIRRTGAVEQRIEEMEQALEDETVDADAKAWARGE